MSADNGIYILVTGTGNNKEYRVKELQAVDNVNWDSEITDYTSDPDIRIKNARRMWKNCTPYKKRAEAMEQAGGLYEEIMESTFPVLEYGICFIEIPKDF